MPAKYNTTNSIVRSFLDEESLEKRLPFIQELFLTLTRKNRLNSSLCHRLYLAKGEREPYFAHKLTKSEITF